MRNLHGAATVKDLLKTPTMKKKASQTPSQTLTLLTK